MFGKSFEDSFYMRLEGYVKFNDVQSFLLVFGILVYGLFRRLLYTFNLNSSVICLAPISTP